MCDRVLLDLRGIEYTTGCRDLRPGRRTIFGNLSQRDKKVPQEMAKTPNGSFSTRPALSPTTFAQVIVLPWKLFQSFPPIRSPETIELTRRLNYPSSLWFEELQTNGIAVAMHWLAVSHSSLGAKLTGARCKNQLRTLFPTPRADHARTTCTDIFGERGFRAGKLPMSLKHHGDFHRNAIFPARG